MTRNSPAEVLGARMPRLLRLYSVPGCSVACISDGQVIWNGAFGVADEVARSRVSAYTRFQVASISKTITAWAALKLVAQGCIGLDDPVDGHLRRWRIPSSPYATTGITLRTLLSHTAGFSSGGSGLHRRPEEAPLLEDALRGAGGATAAKVEVDPGTQFRYSNPGYAVIELLIEELTGERFADWVQREVLDPLHLRNSTFDRQAAYASDAAAPHRRRGRPLPLTVPSWLAAGAMLSTADDLAQVAIAMTGYGPGGRGANVLAADLVEEMWIRPKASEGAFRLRTGGYGLGQVAGRLAGGTRFVASQGTRPGWRSLLVCLPDRGEGLVVLTNGNGGTALTFHAVLPWLRRVAGERLRLHKLVRLR